MKAALAQSDQSCLVIIDLQESFMRPIEDAGDVVHRSEFLLETANLLKVPVIATEQYPSRMGGTVVSIRAKLPSAPIDKMSFGCGGAPAFVEAVRSSQRSQFILVGIEAHICVCQTALQLIAMGHTVFLCLDAVSARSMTGMEAALARLRDAGVIMTHTESVAYEWMGTADHPQFRDALKIVKAFDQGEGA